MQILIVEDNDINRKLLKLSLNAAGFSTVEAVDGWEALVILQREKVDLIISDILMPNMDGYRLCVEIRKNSEFCNIPLIFYTSTYTSQSDERFALEIGANRFIRKPTPIKALVAIIKEVVSESQQRLSLPLKQPEEIVLMKNYNERLINKLEDKNASLQRTQDKLLQANQELVKRTEEVQKSTKEIQEIFENIQDILYRTDKHGIISMISPSIERYGYKVAELIGKDVGLIYADPLERDLLIKTLTEKRLVGDLEIKLKHQSGEIFYASANARLLIDEQGHPFSIEGFLRDISQRKAIERYLEIQYTVMRLLTESDNSKSAKTQTLEIMCENLKCEIGNIWIIDQTSKVLKHLQTWHFSTPEIEAFSQDSRKLSFSVGVDLLGQVWADGQSVWRTDLATNANLPRLVRAAQAGLRSAIVCPIMLGKEIMGILEFFSAQIRPFDTVLLNLVASMGNQLGQFMERKRVAVVKEESIRLAALNAHIGYALIQKNSLSEILNATVQAIIEYLPAAFARIWTFNKVEKILELQASAGIYPHLDDPHAQIPLGKYKVGWIAQELKPYWTNSIIDDPQIDNQEWAKKEGMVAFAGYPLIVAEQLVGAMDLFVKQELTEATLLALKTIASEIAIGIERKRTESALKESKNRFALFMNNLPGIAFIKDAQGRFIYVNDNLEAILSQTTTSWYNKVNEELFPLHIASEYTAHDKFAFEHNESLQIVEPLQQNEAIHHYLITRFPLSDHTTNTILLGGIGIDITDRMQAEANVNKERALLAIRVEERTAQLRFANAQLERVSRLKDEFLANMSHELRTPLNAILGLSEVLREGIYGILNEKQQRSLGTIEESGRHLLALINDILDLSKIEAGKLELVLAPTSLETVCQSSLRIIKETAIKKQLNILTTSNNMDMLIQADELRLKQILVNLLSNAVKFTPPGGSIGLEVFTDAKTQTINFTVWDNGIGISKEDIPRLFKPFIQLDSSLARQHPGTGLGLALVSRMVEMHGGSVSVESTLNQGSRFMVSIPWQIPNASPLKTELALIEMTEIMGKRILVIEDVITEAEMLARYLLQMDTTVDVYTQGRGAIQKVLEFKPDIIMLDIQLPDISGWDLLVQLKDDPLTQAIPIIIVTGEDNPEKRLSLGVSEYLIKPVTRLQVLDAIKRVLLVSKSSILGNTKGADSHTPSPLILLAEDNPANVETISEYLLAKGYRIITAENGIQALELAVQHSPQLILMDIQMPRINGLQAIREIRTNPLLADTPIIAITALAMTGDRERCLKAGANDYLSKPLKLAELVKRIENYLL